MQQALSQDTLNIKLPKRLKGPIPEALRMAFRNLGPIAPKMMGRLAYKLWFSPRRIKRPQWEVELFEAAYQRTMTIAGQEINVQKWGDTGPTVLLVHGWEGRGTQLGYFIQPLMEKGFSVVAFDCAGHGASTGNTTDAVEIKQAIEQIAADEGGLHGIITHSFGAVPAAWAMASGVKVKAAGLVCPPSQFRFMLDIFAADLDIPRGAMEVMRHKIINRFPELGERIWHDLCTHNSASTFEHRGIVIHDVDDTVVPIGQGLMVAEAWDGACFLETQGLGHRRILKDVNVIKNVVRIIKG